MNLTKFNARLGAAMVFNHSHHEHIDAMFDGTNRDIEPLYFVAKIRAMHNVGNIGDNFTVTANVLSGMVVKQSPTLIRKTRLSSTFNQQVIGVLDFSFVVEFLNIQGEAAVGRMKDSLISIIVSRERTENTPQCVLELENVNQQLVEKRHVAGSLEFVKMGDYQVLCPNAHMFASFSLLRAKDMESSAIRSADSIIWNDTYKKFEIQV